jgi:hypothetical protein
MKKVLIWLFIANYLLIIGCGTSDASTEPYPARTDVRFGNKFYSVFVNEQGDAYVIRGIGTNYTEVLKIEKADTSNRVKLDSAKVFFDRLKEIQTSPVYDTSSPDAPRVEIYCNNHKIYDSYIWSNEFLNLFRPVMMQLPNGFNPFLISERPFE